MLSEILPHAEKYPEKLFGNGYIMASVEGKGIQWTAMSCKMISETGILHINNCDKLDIASFKKVCIEVTLIILLCMKLKMINCIMVCSTTCWSMEIILSEAI